MQKVVQFLEKNVEWIAVTLGCAFMLWMVWTYLIVNPVQQTFNGTVVTPGTVDQVISDGPATDLDHAIHTQTAVSYPTQDFTGILNAGLDLKYLKVTPMTNAWDYEPLNLGGGPAVLPGGAPTGGGNVAGKVNKLPDAPAAKSLLVAAGQSTIIDSTSAHTDVNWAAILDYVPAGTLKDEWTNVFSDKGPGGKQTWKLDPEDLKTVFLSAKLYRSQKDSKGNWSQETEIPRLWNNTVADVPAGGSAQDLKTAEDNFLRTIADKQADVVSPKFPDQAPAPAGTNIPKPDELAASAHAGGAATKPADASALAVSTDPDIQTPPIATLPAVAPTFKTASFNPADAASPDYLICMYDTTLKPGVIYRYRIDYSLANPLFHKDVSHAANQGMVDTFELKAPMSDPSPEISVQSKTRFYCALSTAPHIASDPHLGVFNVHVLAGGVWQMATFKVEPGDPIGSVSPKDNIDYSTGYTYVDVLHENNSQLIKAAYMDDDGTVTVVDASEEAKKEQSVFAPVATPPPGTPGAAPVAPSDTPPVAPAPAKPPGPSAAPREDR